MKGPTCLAYQLRADHGYCSSCPILFRVGYRGTA
ncbi:hypothetical protein GJB61_04675 [Paenibacillus sp. LC-T2]|uniref:Ferric siderophore reductase C-terminal domain-containing protein n=1 Tax=Paenibacillus monticola TaxID=2666075 RepID=A0A7X2H2D8_9BACL|nr:hypothetical protein [Paenibacillus monticola]